MGNARVLLAGSGSGSGKTTITCSILYKLIQENFNVVSFKCGPDYIDPMFHRDVIGSVSYNLDSFFLEGDRLKAIVSDKLKTADYGIIEGVMGYYDGASYTTKGSSYEIAKITDTPVILIINAGGCANSIEAYIKGFVTLEENSKIRGIILNRASAKTYEYMQPVIRKYGLVPCGYVNRLNEELTLSSRHLGLDYDYKRDELLKRLKRMSQSVCKTLDMDAIKSLAQNAGEIFPNEDITTKKAGNRRDRRIRVALAKDEAFSFIYQENLDILSELGVDIVPFSPLNERKLPEDIAGLLLYGGYPEKYAKELSDNTSMKEDIRKHIQKGLPTIAECGGYMYLKDNLICDNNEKYAMCGVIDGDAFNCGKLVRFGYITLESNEDNAYMKKGELIRAHEFHYWDCIENGDSYTAKKTDGTQYACIYARGNLMAGFPHIYYPSNEQLAKRFADECRNYRVNYPLSMI